MDESKKLLKKIFTITEPDRDLDSYVDFFSALIFEDTITHLIRKLPKAKRESVAKKWDANVQNTAALSSIIKHNFTAEQIDAATQEVTHNAIVNYLDRRLDTFTPEQKEKIKVYAEKYVPVEERPVKKGGSFFRKFVR